MKVAVSKSWKVCSGLPEGLLARSISNVLFVAEGAVELVLLLLEEGVLLVPGMDGGGDNRAGEFLKFASRNGDANGDPMLLPCERGLGERISEPAADVAVAVELDATGDRCLEKRS